MCMHVLRARKDFNFDGQVYKEVQVNLTATRTIVNWGTVLLKQKKSPEESQAQKRVAGEKLSSRLEQIDVIKTTLKNKNVVQNKVNKNLDDYDHQKDEDEKRNISLGADNIELTEDQEGNAIEVIISQRQNDANNIDYILFEPIDSLPKD
ncbi:hypothetical protein HELRODRAFT_160478 [Helobdella robusta]|uniref:Uncharacterized protein n=1 Tax=Helobdella robusta TaxID=6412 RepID=T1EQA7_HELRO|nr:hypothetical protein HELRODRAFT_160478 [Helobdella robusta]ESO06314.1 hypothetical protein HELRODRAFT_160478 [Helobdella robusta]